MGLFFVPDHADRDDERRRRGRRARVGPVQHGPAGRRRARARGALDARGRQVGERARPTSAARRRRSSRRTRCSTASRSRSPRRRSWSRSARVLLMLAGAQAATSRTSIPRPRRVPAPPETANPRLQGIVHGAGDSRWYNDAAESAGPGPAERGNQCGQRWPRGRIAASDRGVAHGASPSAHLVGDADDGQGYRTHPRDRARWRARLAGTADGRAQEGRRAAPQVAKVQRWLGQPADGDLRPRHAARRQALAAAPRARRPTASSARRPGRALRRAHRAASARTQPPRPACARAARAVRTPAARARHRRRRRLRPGHAAPPSSASSARRGLAADGVVGPATWAALGHAGVARRCSSAAAARRAAPARLPLRVRRIIAAGNRIAGKPYKYGGGHGQWNDTRLRLLGLGLLRAARRRPARQRAHLGRLHELGRAGPGRWVTIYAYPGHVYMVVDGRRFDTTGRDESGSRWQSQLALVGGLRRPPPARPLAPPDSKHRRQVV